MTASALVAADAALERGEVPTVPHAGSPVLWASVNETDRAWQTTFYLSHIDWRPLMTPVSDDWHHHRQARASMLDDLRYSRGERLASPAQPRE